MVQFVIGLSLIAGAMSFVGCVLLYLDGKGQRKALAAAEKRFDALFVAQGHKLGSLATGLSTLGTRVEHRTTEIRLSVDALDRRISQVGLGLETAMYTAQRHENEIANLARRVGYRDRELADVAIDTREHRLPPGSETAPPVDTEGDRHGVIPDAPTLDDHDTPKDAPLNILGRMAGLTSAELTRLDALAELHGVTREAMLGTVFASGSQDGAANDSHTAGPTTPPEGPANDADKRRG